MEEIVQQAQILYSDVNFDHAAVSNELGAAENSVSFVAASSGSAGQFNYMPLNSLPSSIYLPPLPSLPLCRRFICMISLLLFPSFLPIFYIIFLHPLSYTIYLLPPILISPSYSSIPLHPYLNSLLHSSCLLSPLALVNFSPIIGLHSN